MSPRMLCSIQLWSINRWLRYTGFRMFVSANRPTILGIAWYGWGDL